jgi:KDO2-lipid IV(A) lauroyltransferase
VPIRRAAAALLAAAARLAGFPAARVTRTNLSLCYPHLAPADLRRLTAQSLYHSALLLLESGIVLRRPATRLDELILETRGLDLLEGALASGRGVLLLGPHLGNWEILNLYLGRYGLVALFDPPRQRAVRDLLHSARERTGSSLHPLDRKGLRCACRTLERGGLVGVLPDQVPDREAGAYAPFFNRPALTMTLAHRLIRRYRPIVLIAFARRERNGFAIEIRAVADNVTAADPEISVAAMNRDIEAVVRESPAQYQWEYKRFKREPTGRPPVY